MNYRPNRFRKRPSNPSEANSERPFTPKPIEAKIMDYLAMRDHSESELRKKLAKNYGPEDIDRAIADAFTHGYLKPPEDLTESVAESLHRKYKGHLYIQAYLKKLGLPSSKKDPDRELEKAQELAKKFIKDEIDPDHSIEDSSYALKRDLQQKIYRYLSYRGYDGETIRKVLYEKL